MVLSLPILLVVMALMINFGTVACWKVRGRAVARHAVWSTRWPRNSNRSPRPDYWPAEAGVGAGGARSAPALDRPEVDHPVARGRRLRDFEVDRDLLDPSRGFRLGSSDLEDNFPLLFPLLTRLRDTREYHLNTEEHFLDNKWQYLRMGMHWNAQRRIQVLYTLPRTDPALATAYVQAAVAILTAPFRPDLFPLDRDDEFIGYSVRFGWGRGAPDFHPQLERFCGLDHEPVAERVQDLIDRIQGKVERNEDGDVVRRIPSVAERMAQAFINLYRRVIRELQNRIAADPPPPPDEIASMQAEIDDLQTKIDILTQYLQTLQNAAS